MRPLVRTSCPAVTTAFYPETSPAQTRPLTSCLSRVDMVQVQMPQALKTFYIEGLHAGEMD